MNHSEEINELATALSKAQGAMGASGKSGTNPFFKHAYATFDDVLAAVKKPLANNDLAFVQLIDKNGEGPVLITMLMHKSGQYIKSGTPLTAIPSKGTNALQDFGKAVTYMKRYALAAMLGVASDMDDDGNSADKVEVDFDATEPIAPKGKAPHWIEDRTVQKRFWAKWHAEGLSNDDVHNALQVGSVKDYVGTMDEALAEITAYIKANTG